MRARTRARGAGFGTSGSPGRPGPTAHCGASRAGVRRADGPHPRSCIVHHALRIDREPACGDHSRRPCCGGVRGRRDHGTERRATPPRRCGGAGWQHGSQAPWGGRSRGDSPGRGRVVGRGDLARAWHALGDHRVACWPGGTGLGYPLDPVRPVQFRGTSPGPVSAEALRRSHVTGVTVGSMLVPLLILTSDDDPRRNAIPFLTPVRPPLWYPLSAPRQLGEQVDYRDVDEPGRRAVRTQVK